MSREHPSLQIRPKKEHRGQGMASLHGTSKNKYEEEATLLQEADTSVTPCGNGRERLQRHRKEVAGKVWIPEIWGQEELLKDWVDCSEFDACLVPSGVVSARAALVHQASSTPDSPPLRIHNRC